MAARRTSKPKKAKKSPAQLAAAVRTLNEKARPAAAELRHCAPIVRKAAAKKAAKKKEETMPTKSKKPRAKTAKGGRKTASARKPAAKRPAAKRPARKTAPRRAATKSSRSATKVAATRRRTSRPRKAQVKAIIRETEEMMMEKYGKAVGGLTAAEEEREAARWANPIGRRGKKKRARKGSSKRKGTTARAKRRASAASRASATPRAARRSRRGKRRSNPIYMANPRKARRRNARRGHRRSSGRRRNPTFSVMQTAAAVLFTGLAFTLAELGDRFLATRAADGAGPFYGPDAAIRITQKPGLLRIGAQAGVSVASFLAAYYVKNPSAKAVLGGVATGTGVHLVFQLVMNYGLPMVLKAKTNDTKDKSLGARLLPEEQIQSQNSLKYLVAQQVAQAKAKQPSGMEMVFMWIANDLQKASAGNSAPAPVSGGTTAGLAGGSARYLPQARPQMWPESSYGRRAGVAGAEPVAVSAQQGRPAQRIAPRAGVAGQPGVGDCGCKKTVGVGCGCKGKSAGGDAAWYSAEQSAWFNAAGEKVSGLPGASAVAVPPGMVARTATGADGRKYVQFVMPSEGELPDPVDLDWANTRNQEIVEAVRGGGSVQDAVDTAALLTQRTYDAHRMAGLAATPQHAEPVAQHARTAEGPVATPGVKGLSLDNIN